MNKSEKLPEDLHERSALGFGRNLVAGKPATMSVNYYFDGKYFIDPGTQKKCGALYGAKIESGIFNSSDSDVVQYYIVMDWPKHEGEYSRLGSAKDRMVELMRDRLHESLGDYYQGRVNSRVEIEWVDWGKFDPRGLLYPASVYNDALAKMSRSLKPYTMESAANDVLYKASSDLSKCLAYDTYLEGIEISDKVIRKLTQRKLQEWDVEEALRLANTLSIISSPEKVKENRTHLV